MDSDQLANPREVLETLAEEFGETLDYNCLERDSGKMSEPTRFDCTLTAGKFIIKTSSHSRAVAELLAAQDCLDKMKESVPSLNIPQWKRIEPVDSNLDPVVLLMNYCRDTGLIGPSFTCSYGKEECSEESNVVYNCIVGKCCTQGRGVNKYYASRLAAFEMLDDLIRTRGNPVVHPGEAGSYVSVEPHIAQTLKDDTILMTEYEPEPSSFPVMPNVAAVEGVPNIRIRYGMKPKMDAGSSDSTRKLRCTTEYQLTFRGNGLSPAEAMNKCMENVQSYASILSVSVPEGNISSMAMSD